MTNKRDSPRLRFSKEELENPKLARKVEKAEQAAEHYDHARKKLQTHRLKLTVQEVQQEQKTLRQDEVGTSAVLEPDLSASTLETKGQQALKKGRIPVDAKPSGKGPSGKEKTQAAGEAAHAAAPKGRKKIRLRFEETEAKPPPRLQHPVQRPSSRRTISCTDNLQRPTRMTTLRQAQRSRAMGSGLLLCRWASTPIMRTSCARSERHKRRNKGWTKPTFGISQPGNAPKSAGCQQSLVPLAAKAGHPQGVCRAESRRRFPGWSTRCRKGRAQNRQCHGKDG